MSWVNLPPRERNALANQLTERQIHIYILRLGGYSWIRISQDTGLSIRTVRTHYQRAEQIHQYVQQTTKHYQQETA